MRYPMSNEFRNIYSDLFGATTSSSKSNEIALKRAEAALNEAMSKFGLPDMPVADAVNKPETATEEKNTSGTQTEVKAEEKKEPETDPMDDLNELIGLKTIKHDVHELYDFTKIQRCERTAE